MNKIYAGIGSRETPIDILQLMYNIATHLGSMDWTLRSGGAAGADTSFDKGCTSVNGKKEIFLPWAGYHNLYGKGYEVPPITPELINIAGEFHPAWDKCSTGVKKLYARNVYQLTGTNDINTDIVICWTANGKRGGGTGQALRIAEYLEIPIFDLALPETMAKLTKYIQEIN